MNVSFGLGDLVQYLPFLIPLALLQFGLMIFAAVHVVRHPNVRVGSQIVWLIVVLVFSFIGPVAYFIFGRGDE